MTPDQIRQVYDTGPEAVVALVTRLLDTATRQSEQIALLTARVQALESQLAKDSHNSGKPPSSDGLTKPAPKSLRQKSGRRPGGQPGHPGATLGWAETPDQIIEHRPERCASCGEPLTPAATVSVERRQVHDLPPLRLLVTEHQAHTCVCPACRQPTEALFPLGVDAPVQYGAQVQALGVYLTCYQLLPFARSARLLHDLLGVCLGPGTLSAVQRRCSDRLGPVTEQIKAALTCASLAHFDETGARIGGRLHWLRVLLGSCRVHAADDLLRRSCQARAGGDGRHRHPAALRRQGGPRRVGLLPELSLCPRAVQRAPPARIDLFGRRRRPLVGAGDEAPAAGHQGGC